MMKIIINLLLSFLLSFQVLAAQNIRKGEVAPYDGMIFTEQEADQITKDHQQFLQLKDLQILYKEKIEIQNQRINNLKEYVEDDKNLTFWGKALYFGLGVLATGAAFYGTSLVLKNVEK